MNIKINSNNSSEYLNKFFFNSFQSPIPGKTEKRVNVLGSQGSKLVSYRYNDRILKIECYLTNQDLREELRNLVNFLDIDNNLLISFDNDPTLFYYGTFKQIDNLDIKNYRGTTIDISFTVEPEIYRIINELIDLDTINSLADIELLTLDTDYIKSLNPYIAPL